MVYSLMAVSVLVSTAGNGIPKKFGEVLLLDKKIILVASKASCSCNVSPNAR